MTSFRVRVASRAAVWLATLVAAALTSSSARACESNAECKAPRVCSASVCAYAPADSVQPCTRDLDCGGDEICQAHECGPALTPAIPQASPPHSTTESPRSSSDDDIDRAPPPPTPGLFPPYYHRLFPKPVTPPIGVRFDLLAGGGLALGQAFNHGPQRNDFGVAVDAQLVNGVSQNLALGVRAGTVLMPSELKLSSVYGAGGFYLPDWHWGLFFGGGSAVAPNTPREGGVVVEMPFDVPLGRFLKLGLVLGFDLYHTFMQETARLEIGF
jgi:hypothetical protein